MNNLKLITSIMLAFLVLSCDSEKKISRDVFDEVQKAHSVKKLSEVDIINEAMEWGEEISKEAQEQLMGNLQVAIAEKGTFGALGFCNVEALPIIKEMGDKYGISIRRVSNDFRNPIDRPSEIEKPLLDAYEYNVETGIENRSNIQAMENGDLLFTKAIIISGGMCLNCHGEPGKDIDEETLSKINQLYPEDKARGHQIGDLRGIWSIAIPQKKVVERL